WAPGVPTRLSGRWLNLLPWAVGALERRIDVVGPADPSTPLAYEGTAPQSAAAVSMGLRTILNRAGLAGDSTVQPKSIRAWGGRRLYDECGDIEEVAHRLGLDSLNGARRLIGLPDREHDVPPPHRTAQ